MNVTEHQLETKAAELEKQLAAANAQITGLKAWIMAANQFAWAHEKGCPRYTRDAPCNCGLDQFLGRPRPFIESYKQQLDAANQRIEELELSNRDGQRLINELNGQLADAEHAKEAAERKLAEIASYASAECSVPTPPESQDWASREEWTIEWIRRVATGEQARGQIKPDVDGLEALVRRHHQ